ncbi:tetratricopeptide repeat protein [Alkalihalobacillus deserti]|uniref:tetratricopeptide repeat protein n=1 Tax=Alkalihalobacillus deserti TaxID=2879466 RepID=UPI001D13839E|nr:tetratricopeptide repeat protein [Alkalihalobacillus deserti]
MGIISLFRLKKYDNYVYRAVIYEDLFLRKKAIQTMESAVKNQRFNIKEIASGYFYLGELYSKMRDYGKASNCYQQGLELSKDEKFFYSSNLKKAIETFVKNKDIEIANFWLNNLLQRQSYDKKFKKLAIFENQIR